MELSSHACARVVRAAIQAERVRLRTSATPLRAARVLEPARSSARREHVKAWEIAFALVLFAAIARVLLAPD